MIEFIGRQIDNYRIDAVLGEGGMGVVFRAYDLNLAMPVALKMMHPHLARQPEFQQRFLQEARAAALLSEHPSIVRILYFGKSQSFLYMVMAYVSGGSLSSHLQRMQKTGEIVRLQEILALLAQVADALGFAHRHNVIHRDVKPSNVLVQRLENIEREGELPLRAIVTDFGLAKLLNNDLETQFGGLMGTYAYMSPEQCLRKELDGRSDIYSLGVMLYQLTTGKLPFDIQSATDAVMKHLNEIPPAPREVSPELPEFVDLLIRKAIAKKPEERFQTAEAMAKALREVSKKLTEAEITHFTQQRATFSLATVLGSDSPPSEPSRMGLDQSPAAQRDQLIIAQKDHTPLTIHLEEGQYTLGRDEDNDIVLKNEDVSRHHIRLERGKDAWQVVDLNSTNGTFISETRLLPGIPEPLAPGQTLRIGPFFIHWQKAERSAISSSSHKGNAKQSLPAGAIQNESRSGQLSVVVNPINLTVAPGSRADSKIELFNLGDLVNHYKLHVDGFPNAWVDVPMDSVELMPGSVATLTFSVHPPLDSSAKAGQYPYTIKVESASNEGEILAIEGQVTIQPFERFALDIQPSQLSSGSKTRLTISNEGNAEAAYSLAGRDPAGMILFEGEHGRLKVLPGKVQTIELSIKAKIRPFTGSIQRLPFEVQVKSTSGASQKKDGQLDVHPLLPLWVLPLSGGLLLALCITAALVLNSIISNPPLSPTKTDVPLGMVPPVTSEVLPTETSKPSLVPGTATSETIEGIGTPNSTQLTPSPQAPSGIELLWRTAEDRIVIEQGQKFWEKYQAGTILPGLYLRTDDINAFGDFLELNLDGTFASEVSGIEKTGTWKVEGNKVILLP